MLKHSIKYGPARPNEASEAGEKALTEAEEHLKTVAEIIVSREGMTVARSLVGLICEGYDVLFEDRKIVVDHLKRMGVNVLPR